MFNRIGDGISSLFHLKSTSKSSDGVKNKFLKTDTESKTDVIIDKWQKLIDKDLKEVSNNKSIVQSNSYKDATNLMKNLSYLKGTEISDDDMKKLQNDVKSTITKVKDCHTQYLKKEHGLVLKHDNLDEFRKDNPFSDDSFSGKDLSEDEKSI